MLNWGNFLLIMILTILPEKSLCEVEKKQMLSALIDKKHHARTKVLNRK